MLFIMQVKNNKKNTVACNPSFCLWNATIIFDKKWSGRYPHFLHFHCAQQVIADMENGADIRDLAPFPGKRRLDQGRSF